MGIFDPASKIGLNDYEKEDWGQTLGSWGVGEGCYIVLPDAGPINCKRYNRFSCKFTWEEMLSNNVTVRNDTHHFSDFDYYASVATNGIDFRAKNIESLENLRRKFY